MTLLVQQGEHVTAAAAATRLAGHAFEVGLDTCRAACFLVRCVPLAQQDKQLSPAKRQQTAQEYGDQAMTFLAKAEAAGHFQSPSGVEHLKEAAFNSLRSRADFKSFQNALEQKVEKTAK